MNTIMQMTQQTMQRCNSKRGNKMKTMHNFQTQESNSKDVTRQKPLKTK